MSENLSRAFNLINELNDADDNIRQCLSKTQIQYISDAITYYNRLVEIYNQKRVKIR